MNNRVLINCPGCDKGLKVRENWLGHKLTCKHCGHCFRSHRTGESAEPKGATRMPDWEDKVVLSCPECTEQLHVRLRQLGRWVRCYGCGQPFRARHGATSAGLASRLRAGPGLARSDSILGKTSFSQQVKAADPDEPIADRKCSALFRPQGEPEQGSEVPSQESSKRGEETHPGQISLRSKLETVKRQIQNYEAERAAARKWEKALESELNRSVARCHKAERGHAALQAEIATLQGLKPQVASLESKHEAAVQRAVALESELDSTTVRYRESELVRALLETRVAALEELEQHVAELRDQLVTARARNQEFEESRVIIAALEQHITGLEGELTNANRRIVTLGKELNEAIGSCRQAEARNSAMDGKVLDLERERDAAVVHRQEADQSCAAMETRIASLVAERSAALTALEQELAAARSGTRDAETSRAALEVQMATVEAERDVAVSRVATRQLELDDAMTCYEQTEKNRMTLETSVAAMEARLADASKHVAALEAELALARTWKREVEQTRAEIGVLNQRAAALADERTIAIKRADSLESELARSRAWSKSAEQVQGEIDKLREQVSDLETERDAARRRIVQLETDARRVAKDDKVETLSLEPQRDQILVRYDSTQPCKPEVVDWALALEDRSSDIGRRRQPMQASVRSRFHNPAHLSERLLSLKDRLEMQQSKRQPDDSEGDGLSAAVQRAESSSVNGPDSPRSIEGISYDSEELGKLGIRIAGRY